MRTSSIRMHVDGYEFEIANDVCGIDDVTDEQALDELEASDEELQAADIFNYGYVEYGGYFFRPVDLKTLNTKEFGLWYSELKSLAVDNPQEPTFEIV